MKKNNDNAVQMIVNYDEAMETVLRVETALAEQGLKCHSSSALGSLFAMVRRLANKSKKLDDKKWRATFLRANEAIRIAKGVEAALNDPGAKEAIHRITSSDMSLSTRQESSGKDALWELELYRRFKLGKIPVYFAEPDLVVSLGSKLGEYAIACKKIYSLNNVQKSFKDGCDQLKTHGRPGVIAFNLDDLFPATCALVIATEHELKEKLDALNKKFIRDNERHFLSMVERGVCDGVLVSTSVTSDVSDMNPPVNVIRSSAAWTNRREQGALDRFNIFLECHDRVTLQLAASE
ncbi:hypothetical protein [Pseudomonas sp.]|uniref:hypothetical protein n=1 Tax=Pseudomonas sp. TaxID=306 RepID=UPI0026387A1B|nr:hypothetical protein [Pseudomonas sp.]